MPEYKKRMDMHTHTDNSPDGNHSTMYLCECAEQTGLRAIAFTDHCEVDAYYKDHYDRAAFQAYFEVVKARSVFRGRLIVAAGIELGQPAYDPALAEQILSKFDYDVVIGSVHNLRGRKDFYFMEYDGFTDSDLDAMVEEYLKELLTMGNRRVRRTLCGRSRQRGKRRHEGRTGGRVFTRYPLPGPHAAADSY